MRIGPDRQIADDEQTLEPGGIKGDAYALRGKAGLETQLVAGL